MSQTPDAATFPQSNPESRLSFMQRSAIRRRLAETIAFASARAPVAWVDQHFEPLGGLLNHHGLGESLEAIDPGDERREQYALGILLAAWRLARAEEVMRRRRRSMEIHQRISGAPFEQTEEESRELKEAANVLTEGRADLIDRLGELLDSHPDDFNAITASMVWIIDTITTEAEIPAASAGPVVTHCDAEAEEKGVPKGERVEAMRAAACDTSSESDEPISLSNLAAHPVFVVGFAQEAVEQLRPAAELPPSDPLGAKRIHFDDASLLVVIDGGKPIYVPDPKAYGVFKTIALACPNIIQRPDINREVPGTRGDRTIPSLIAKLPEPLEAAIRSDTRGYWLQLPAARKKGNRRQ